MYVEIPVETTPILRDKLEEGKVVIMKKFVVERAKDLFKVVPGAYMIKLNKRTEIIPVDPEPPLFPRYVFTLTPFEELEEHKNKKDKFLGNTKFTLKKSKLFILNIYICVPFHFRCYWTNSCSFQCCKG
jgi:hypothetical protein